MSTSSRAAPVSEAQIRADERRKMAAEMERRATALSSGPDPDEYIYAAAVTYREAAHVIREQT